MDIVRDLAYAAKRRMYSGDRAGTVARVLNRASAWMYSSGVLSPKYAMTLEVNGRRTGRPVELPVVIANYEGRRYLVSMLGQNAAWVHNVHAADGRAVLHRRGSEAVQLTEVDIAQRAPILRRYLAVAPGARPHFPIDRTASLDEFGAISARYPVFLIEPAG